MGIWLVMETADGQRPIRIRKSRTIIGRDAQTDLRIAIPSVSRRHCELTLEDDRVRLTDLDSRSGTLHNGNPVHEAILANEDRLTVGPVTFRVRMTDGEDGSDLESWLAPGGPEL